MGFEELLGVNPWTALFTLANTVALFLVMKKFLWVPVLKMIEDRQQEIDSMYAEADSAQAEAKRVQAEYQQKLSVAAETSERMVKEAVVRGQNREEEIIRQAFDVKAVSGQPVFLQDVVSRKKQIVPALAALWG